MVAQLSLAGRRSYVTWTLFLTPTSMITSDSFIAVRFHAAYSRFYRSSHRAGAGGVNEATVLSAASTAARWLSVPSLLSEFSMNLHFWPHDTKRPTPRSWTTFST